MGTSFAKYFGAVWDSFTKTRNNADKEDVKSRSYLGKILVG